MTFYWPTLWDDNSRCTVSRLLQLVHSGEPLSWHQIPTTSPGLARGPGIERRWDHEIISIQRHGGPKLLGNARTSSLDGGGCIQPTQFNPTFRERCWKIAHSHHFLRPHNWNSRHSFNTAAFPHVFWSRMMLCFFSRTCPFHLNEALKNAIDCESTVAMYNIRSPTSLALTKQTKWCWNEPRGICFI